MSKTETQEEAVLPDVSDLNVQLAKHLLDAMEQTNIGFLLWGPDHRLVARNKAVEVNLGPIAEHLQPGITFEALHDILVKRRLNSGLDPVEVEQWRDRRIRAFTTPRHSEEMKRPDGYWIRINNFALADGGMVALHQDITAEVEAREHLEANEERYRALFELASDAIMVIDTATAQYVEVSRRAAQERGYTVDEFLNLKLYDIDPKVTPDLFADRVARLQTGAINTFDTEHQRKDGTSFPVENNSTLVRIDDKWYVQSICRDITERQELSRLQDEMIARVSHELRTPLTSVAGAVNLVKEEVAGAIPEKAKEMLQIASSNCARLGMLVDDLLDLKKSEDGQSGYKFAPFPASKLLENAVTANQSFADEYEVSLIVMEPTDESSILGDEARLQQVMSNLISNAVKYSSSGDQVKLQESRRGDQVRISVIDNGPGIPHEFRDRIFDRFSQADDLDSRTVMGTGLGLSIAKTIVEAHEGTLDFDSTLGQGTEFYFDLPLHS